MHTYFWACAIIIDVTPPIHYIVFATPHKTKYLLLKRPATPLAFLIILQKGEDLWNRDRKTGLYVVYLQGIIYNICKRS